MMLPDIETRLLEAGIKTARLDALVLAEHVSGVDRAQLLADWPELSDHQSEALEQLITQRIQRQPLAYLTGQKEFYGRQFHVSRQVLIPRPESEDMIDLAMDLQLDAISSIVDIGCGSGCLGITYALEHSKGELSNVDWLRFIDISATALEICQQNASKHGLLNCKYTNDDFTRQVDAVQAADLIFANLPYVPQAHSTALVNDSPELASEPQVALYAANDGLELYRKLFPILTTGQYVIVESLASQHQELDKIAESRNCRLVKRSGLASCFYVAGVDS